MHSLYYGLLSQLFHLTFRRKKISFIPIAPLTVLLFSIGEEFFQKTIPVRTFNINDMIANLSGIIMFYLLDLIYISIRKKEKNISIFEDIRHFSVYTNEKIAVVFGASGLVGRNLVELLSKDERYKEIKVFNRRNIIYESPKVKQINCDLENIDDISKQISGDDLFCCLGSTMKKAGSKEAFEFIDYVIPVKLSRIAFENKFTSFIAISSMGTNRITNNFYLNVKGRMEKGIQQFGIHNIAVVRPSIILGKRNEFRISESIGKIFMRIIKPFLIGNLKKYRAIEAKTIAKSMITIANQRGNKFNYDSEEIELLASINN
jgi:hypothetical protein